MAATFPSDAAGTAARERFDRLCAGGPAAWGDAERELATFLPDLAAGDPGDERRMLWHLARIGFPGASELAMFRRMADGGSAETVRRAAGAVVSRFTTGLERVGERIASARSVATAARGTGGLDEVFGVLWVADGHLTQGRILEALAKSGRAMELAAAAGAPAPWARAAGLRVNIALNLGLHARASALITRIEVRAAEWTGRARAIADFEVNLARMNLAAHRSEPEEALRVLEVVDDLARRLGIPWERHEAVRSVVRTWALSALGREDEAVAAKSAPRTPLLFAELAAEVNRVSGIWTSQGAAAALEPARAFLRRLESLSAEERETCGPARVCDLASIVAEPLAAGGDVAASLRALDIAGVEAVGRLAELQDRADAGDTLAAPSAEDHEILAEARHAWSEDRRTFLAAVARAIETAARSGGMDIHVLLAAREDHVTACAWCGSVRAGEDRWIPFEMYLPETSRLTHGACPGCAAGLRRDVSRLG